MDKNEVYPIIIHHPGVFYPSLGLTPHSLPLPRPLILSFSLTLTDAPDSPLPAFSSPYLPLRRTDFQIIRVKLIPPPFGYLEAG
ncbi:hypothetical protein NC651_002204 [Populus alba x Populus x berolinensis]|nr:hypothetical protein NC651_002204 [Populus alba x Populus x berolinensis]